MRRYETIVILNPDLSEDIRKSILDRIGDEITKQNGFLVNFDQWGSRNLAYEIKKKTRGYYVRTDYCGAGPLVNELERFFRIDDRVLKFMTVLLEEDADIEAIKAELAEAAEQKNPEPTGEPAAETATPDGEPTDESSPPAETAFEESPPTETASEESPPAEEAQPENEDTKEEV